MTTPVDKETQDHWIAKFEVPRLQRARYRKALSGVSRKAAMEAYCVMCMGWEGDAVRAVRECDLKGCPLWPYRNTGGG